MSWPFRTLVLGVLLLWGLAPQIACFMPDQAMTPAEMDCCKEMIGDCSAAATMTHACCKTVVRTDVGIAAKLVRHDAPQLDVADKTPSIGTEFFFTVDRQLSRQTDHSPPDKFGESSLILRI